MTIEDLMEIASARIPSAVKFGRVADAASPSNRDLCDEISRRVAELFFEGRCAYVVADAIMNNLFAFAHSPEGPGLSSLSWKICLAFDEGERIHDGEPPELQGEYRTPIALGAIPSLGFRELHENPQWRETH